MTQLFILQLVCCTITAMLALHLAMASLQVRWKQQRYEISRWLLCGAMLLFSIHYFLQMTLGFSGQGADVGAVFNIMFYTPVSFIITISIINMESTTNNMLRYCLRGAAAYALIAIVFVCGVIQNDSLRIGSLLYVMLALFVASMAYFIYSIRYEIQKRKKKLLEESATDLMPYVRYAQTSLTLLYISAAFLPIVILFNTLLLYVGPLMLLIIVFFVHSFVSLGYYISPDDNIINEQDELVEQIDNADIKDEELKVQAPQELLSQERLKQIETALRKWCEDGMYKDCNVTIYSLAANLGCKKYELTEYFNLSEHTNFRTWLSDIRFNEAIRIIKNNPEYNNDTISIECGFSSHTHRYTAFLSRKRGFRQVSGAIILGNNNYRNATNQYQIL